MALLKAYDLLQQGINREEALRYAETSKTLLDAQQVQVAQNSTGALQQIAHQMMGYNIVAMVFAWNNQINRATEVDSLDIHHPPLWEHLEAYIKPYLEILMVQR